MIFCAVDIAPDIRTHTKVARFLTFLSLFSTFLEEAVIIWSQIIEANVRGYRTGHWKWMMARRSIWD